MMSVIDAHYFALMSADYLSAEQYFVAANQAMAAGELTQAEHLFQKRCKPILLVPKRWRISLI
jgi:hypothetical protein